MKGVNSQMKWAMHREEETQLRAERRQDHKDLTAWREREIKDSQALDATARQERLQTELRESREFQQVKRANKELRERRR